MLSSNSRKSTQTYGYMYNITENSEICAWKFIILKKTHKGIVHKVAKFACFDMKKQKIQQLLMYRSSEKCVKKNAF